MRSIRQYLQAHVTWGSALVLTIGSILLALAIRHLDTLEFDEALEDQTRMLASLVERRGRFIEIELPRELWPEFRAGNKPEYFQFRLSDGSVMTRSESLLGRDLPLLPTATGAPVLMNLRLPDGRRGRIAQIVLTPRVGEEGEEGLGLGDHFFQIPDSLPPDSASVVLGFARSREALDAMLLKVYATLVGMDILLVSLVAILVRRALRRGFQPVEEMNAQILELGPTRLHKRMQLPQTPTELGSVVSALNGFLEELHTVFLRERRFTSDVAHELRTPVAEFRAACEVGAKWADDPALVRRRFENLRESAVNMERTLNDLLDLSRLDRGTVRLETEATPVATLVDSSWSRVCAREGGFGRSLENGIDPTLHLDTDPHKLGQILYNLLSNAVQYSPPDSVIACSSERTSGGPWELRFSNPTKAIEQEDLRHIFERFWRKDAARTAGGHAGLGLSIVQALAETLGIQVAAELSEDKLFTVRLRFSARGAGGSARHAS